MIRVSEALAQIAQKGGGCPIPDDVQGQDVRGSEQPDPAVCSLFSAG